METSAEIISKIDFKLVFRRFNKSSKRKLTARDKKLLMFLFKAYFPVTAADTQRLSEALSVGASGGAKLQLESLEQTMKLVTFDDKKLKLHKNITASSRLRSSKATSFRQALIRYSRNLTRTLQKAALAVGSNRDANSRGKTRHILARRNNRK